jgi:STE24 endopeptidase
VATVTSFVLFGVLRLVSTWDLALDWAGVETIEDPVSLPLVILTFVAGNSVLGLVQSWLSRAHERQADLQALEITNDRDAFIEMMRGLATRNLVDMAPSWWKYARLSHPPPAERMSFATAWQGGDGSDRPPAAAEPGGHGS